MKYTWRFTITTILLIFNLIPIINLDENSILAMLTFIVNLALGWIIGLQIDKYHFAKRELGSAKTSLVDYSYALDSVPLGIGITNEYGEFEFVNDEHSKLYGYSREAFLTKKWHDCYSNEEIDRLKSMAVPQLQKHGKWQGEVIGIRKDGSTFPQEIFLSNIKETQKVICVVRDITEQKQYIDEIKHISEHNELTKLPNRRKLIDDINKSFNESENTTLLFVDLDRFKMVNDTLGHDVGDELLINVAQRLRSFQNEVIKVYHQAGDEFIMLIQNSTIDKVEKIAVEMINRMKEPYYLKGNEVFITTSVGISRNPDHTQDLHDLIKMADTAMYDAKLDGKNTYKFFNMELKVQLERYAVIEAELRKAVSHNELSIHYQPKFNLVDSEIVGLEALIRWENPKLGRVSPKEFIPIAEDTGLVNDIGDWVIKEVISQMAKWRQQGYPLVKTSVNVSQRQFRDINLVHYINSCLSSYQIETKFFEIEITESVMEDFELIIPQLHVLKNSGVGISIDDFGTGFSSLNFIKNLPVDTLKIDQSFIRDLLNDENNNLLVKAIIEIGNTLKLNVVAEGIETEEHLKKLKDLACPVGQGYYFSKPLNVLEIESLLLRMAY